MTGSAAVTDTFESSDTAAWSTLVVRDLEALDALAADWQRLAGSAAEPMQTHAWSAAAARALHAGAKLCVITVRRDSALVAVAPLVEGVRGGVRWLEVLGAAKLGEPVKFLSDNDQSLAALCRALIAQRLPLSLQRLEGEACLRAIGRLARGRAVVMRVTGGSSLCVALDQEREGYLRRLSAERAATLRRKRRQLEKSGAVRFEHVAPVPVDVVNELRAAFDVEARSWKGAAGSAVAARPEMFEFFRLLGERYAADGRLLVRRLFAGTDVAAVHVAVVEAQRCFELKIGYDERFARSSPGMLLTCECLADSVDRGHRAHEFLGNAADWQRPLATSERMLTTLVVYPLSPRGVFALGIDVAGFAWRRLRQSFSRRNAAEAN